MFKVSKEKYSLVVECEKSFFDKNKDGKEILFQDEQIEITPSRIEHALKAFEKNFFLKKGSLYVLEISLKKRKNFFIINKDNLQPAYTFIHSPKEMLRPFFLKNIFKSGLVFKEYQKYGIEWLLKSDARLMADDMGLGKTLQSISAAAKLIVSGKVRSVIIVCPNSLVFNWSNEIRKWLPDFCLTQVSSTKAGIGREKTWNEIYLSSHFIVTSYDQLRSAPNVLKEEEIDLIIFDEAHKLRKSSSKINASINSLNYKKAWALTGTPIEKNIKDLKNLLCTIDKKLNPISLDKFSDSYVRSLTRDYLLRRMKSDVLSEMKEFEENIIYLELSDIQRQRYLNLFKKFLKAERDEQLKLFGELQQLCDIDTVSGSSAKIDFAEELIEKIASNNEKCVVFSFWLNPFEELKKRLDKTYFRSFSEQFDGSLSKEEREEALNNFKSKEECCVLLCSGKIGGEGINLTEANHVIFLNSWWNPSNNDQARDRVIRIGQSKKAYIYYLRTENTIEARLEEILEEKEYITENVIDALIFEAQNI